MDTNIGWAKDGRHSTTLVHTPHSTHLSFATSACFASSISRSHFFLRVIRPTKSSIIWYPAHRPISNRHIARTKYWKRSQVRVRCRWGLEKIGDVISENGRHTCISTSHTSTILFAKVGCVVGCEACHSVSTKHLCTSAMLNVSNLCVHNVCVLCQPCAKLDMNGSCDAIERHCTFLLLFSRNHTAKLRFSIQVEQSKAAMTNFNVLRVLFIITIKVRYPRAFAVRLFCDIHTSTQGAFVPTANTDSVENIDPNQFVIVSNFYFSFLYFLFAFPLQFVEYHRPFFGIFFLFRCIFFCRSVLYFHRLHVNSHFNSLETSCSFDFFFFFFLVFFFAAWCVTEELNYWRSKQSGFMLSNT